MSLAPGTRLGRYELRSVLGAGGMGEVYLAHDTGLDRSVAVKVMRVGTDESTERVRRFAQEAKAASSLNHPNIAHIYEFGSQDELHYIAMEIVEGATLSERIHAGPLSFTDVLSIGEQIASGLAAAHKRDIIHRDIKPANVIVRPDGYVKILDFGLAKLTQVEGHDAATLVMTSPGLIVGTLRYMAPEQLSGGLVTPAADVFSLGTVLYEMLTGRFAFAGTTTTEIASAILTKQPPPLGDIRPDTPPKLVDVVNRALAKLPQDRFATAGELGEKLHEISREAAVDSLLSSSSGHPSVRRRISRRVAVVSAAAVLLVAGILLVSLLVRQSRVRNQTAAVARAEALLKQNRFAEAFDAATSAGRLLPGDRRVRDVIDASSQELTVRTTPAGADVFLQRMDAARRNHLGVTPLVVRVPTTEYLVMIEKRGYASATRTLSLTPTILPGNVKIPAEIAPIERTLQPVSKVPEGMVSVAGGPQRLTGWLRASDKVVELADFCIDRYEVSNRDFAAFISAGGYRNQKLWKNPFTINGRILPFADAMLLFRDTTRLPGPRGWSSGAPPAGLETHPVTGVTWFEAHAYATWKGKTLPTIFQWERAARERFNRPGFTFPWAHIASATDVNVRANFRGKGTMPVDSLPFGASPWGAFHMAGNVAEWSLNQKGAGYAATGGSWDEVVHAFGRTAAFPPGYSSGMVGFRCAFTPPGTAADQGSFALKGAEVAPEYKPVDDKVFGEIRALYEYPRTPLNARIVDRTETPDWIRERIVFNVGRETVPAYLYRPKGFRGPLQVVHFAPGGDVASGLRPLPDSVENTVLAGLIRSGRGVFSVVLKGYSERPDQRQVFPDPGSPEYVDQVVDTVTELRHGLDYLATRKDIDSTRIAFYAVSAGAATGVILTALEASRYRSIIFVGTGIRPREVSVAPGANRINFVPRITTQKLVLHGRYDETTPWKSNGEALFNLLPQPKRLEFFDGPHVPPMDVATRAITRFLDETMGPVAN